MSIHDLVLATIQRHHAEANLRLERLRSQRESLSTVTAGGQSRAMQLGRAIREAEAVERGWHQVSVAAFTAGAQLSQQLIDLSEQMVATVKADPGPVAEPTAVQIGWRWRSESTTRSQVALTFLRCMAHPFHSAIAEPIMDSDDVTPGTMCGSPGCHEQLA